jgi:nucleolar protein 14
MVKSKSKKGVPKPRPKKDSGPNLFERLSNKKRFDVLGRKQKGETRHVGQLRTAAVEKVRVFTMHAGLGNDPSSSNSRR